MQWERGENSIFITKVIRKETGNPTANKTQCPLYKLVMYHQFVIYHL